MRRWLFVVSLFAALPAAAAGNWKQRMMESTDALKAGAYEKALRIDDGVLDEMLGSLGTGDAAAASFGIVLTHRALALAGLGRDADAISAWHEALAVRPVLADSDIGDFGPPGAFLKAHRPEPMTAPTTGKASGIEAPVAVHRTEPMYPAGARAARAEGITIFKCLIDKEGVVRDVHVEKATNAPTLTYATMEALRTWRFKPATRNGEPVEVSFNLTISMRVR